ncbi:MAG: adenylate/guanylate cyclase domain-containing protein [Pseudomonadota bacterium]
MSGTESRYAVMFADVSGSTRLYEMLGDQDAKAIIDETIGLMSEITVRHGGTVVKTIGDEVMSRFPEADAAIHAACDIQTALDNKTAVRPGIKVAVRIGVHWGSALLDNNDLFGDAVNVASRMAGIARARQIITTEDTVGALSSGLAGKARWFDRAPVKGKHAEIDIHEVVWEEHQAVTRIMTAVALPAIEPDSARTLVVQCDGAELPVPNDGSSFLLGRADTCDLVVPATLASRQHARIEFRRGKYILIDQSTNGTWMRQQDGQQVYLRREEAPLLGTGIISLGEEIDDDNPALVHFHLPD